MVFDILFGCRKDLSTQENNFTTPDLFYQRIKAISRKGLNALKRNGPKHSNKFWCPPGD